MSKEQLHTHIKEFFLILLFVLGSTGIYLFNVTSYKQNYLLVKEINLSKIVEALEAKNFTDYVDYYAIEPTNLNPKPGDEIWHKGDREVFKGGFIIEWNEHIECDFTPDNGRSNFTYYMKLASSNKMYTAPVPRTNEADYADSKGFPSYPFSGSDIARYPNSPADCRLVSDMVQHHSYGVTKKKTYLGKVAKVR